MNAQISLRTIVRYTESLKSNITPRIADYSTAVDFHSLYGGHSSRCYLSNVCTTKHLKPIAQ